MSDEGRTTTDDLDAFAVQQALDVEGGEHAFRCVVCGKPGDCDGDCDRDPAAHVHFATECWEQFCG